MATDKLSKCRKKRDFKLTAEPRGEATINPSDRPRFIIQKHDATRLHYDLWLALDGVFKSWTITKGPSLVRMRHDRDCGKRTNCLLIKHRDEFAVEAPREQVLRDNDTSVASARSLDAIASGKGRKPMPFMVQHGNVTADAVWDSNTGLASEERAAKSKSSKSAEG